MDEPLSYEQEIQKKLDALPENVRSLVYSPEMHAVMQEVGAAHQLHIDQIGALESETAAVMIGVTEMPDFASNVREALNVDEATSEALIREINDKLFIKVRESLKNSSVPARKEPLASQLPISPSPAQAPVAQTPVIEAKPATPAHAPTPLAAPAPKPASMPDLSAAESMLSEKKVAAPAPVAAVPPASAASAAPVAPKAAAPAPSAASTAVPTPPQDQSKPQQYKADPYREPIE